MPGGTSTFDFGPVGNRVVALLGIALTAGALALGCACVACAQEYPVKPITMLCWTEAGSAVDVYARAMAPLLARELGQSVVVENRPGAGGMIGQTLAAGAPPDGYTLLYAGGSMAGSRFVNAAFKLDVLRDFSPVSLLQTGKYVLVVHPNVPARNLKEYIALARSSPGKMTYATTGAGQAPYWDAVLFNSMAGIKAVEIPYKASTEGVVDVIAGRVDYFFIGSAAAVANKARLRLLGVTSATRSSAFPDVPTIAESGVPGYESVLTIGAFAPAQTPQALIARLNQEIVRVLQTPEVKEKLFAAGAEVVVSSPAEMLAAGKADMVRWAKVPRPKRLVSVSPWNTRTFSSPTPNHSPRPNAISECVS